MQDALAPPPDRGPTRHRSLLPPALGLLSLLTLAAALRYAHHWTPRAEAIVAAWAVSTLAALAVGSHGYIHRRGRAAELGLALAGLSVLALATAGAAYALTGSAPGCGGG